jgi:hypothetical protein
MLKLTADNYYSPEANREYFSASQVKSFMKCPAATMAELRGEYVKPVTSSLLIGSYVDAFFSGSREMEAFIERNGSKMFKKNGELLAKFGHANDIIDRVMADNLMMEYLTGEKQVIMAAELFGVPWKIKMDVYNEQRIVDLKCVRDFSDIYDKDYGWRSWI